MIEDIDRILLEEATILQRLDVLAREITLDYQDKELTVISLLNGSFIFMADLLRRIPLPLQVDSWSIASYHDTQTSGRVEFRQNHIADVAGRHVLILDDILIADEHFGRFLTVWKPNPGRRVSGPAFCWIKSAAAHPVCRRLLRLRNTQ